MNFNKQYHILPKDHSKWKWFIVIPLFTLIVIFDLYTSKLNNGQLTWTDFISPFIFLLLISVVSWSEEIQQTK